MFIIYLMLLAVTRTDREWDRCLIMCSNTDSLFPFLISFNEDPG